MSGHRRNGVRQNRNARKRPSGLGWAGAASRFFALAGAAGVLLFTVLRLTGRYAPPWVILAAVGLLAAAVLAALPGRRAVPGRGSGKQRRAAVRERILCEMADGYVWSWDVRRDRGCVSAAFARDFGLPGTAFADALDTLCAVIGEDDRGDFRERLEAYVREGRGPYIDEAVMADAEGTARHVLFRGRLEPDARGRSAWFVAIGEDVTAIRRSGPVPNVDGLTRLPDRRSFEAGLAARLSGGQVCGVLLVGINGFKNINNVYGYDAGDQLLRNVALRLRAVAGDTGDIYRFAGDTFAVVFRPADAQDAGQFADAVAEAFKRAWRIKGHEIYATAAVGMALAPGDGGTPQDLMQSAEDAFFREKQHGKSCHVLYPGMQSTAGKRRMTVENGMRRAIENGFEGFSVYYQPVINLEQGKVTGAEALLRFELDGLGEVQPGEFIPLAEYLGLIVPLGRWVLEKACLQCCRWHGNGHADMYVSVNISVMQVLGDDLVELVRRTLDKTGLEPGRLVLEITENMFIQEMDAVVPALHTLREMGVRISLDDFGKGYSSLTHLRDIPLDEVKIDRDFIRGLGKQSYYETFIHTIVTLAHTINLRVTSEGIETQAQRIKLTELGSDNGQGFYVSPALHPESLLAML